MGSDDYKFLQIVDAMASLNQRVNIAGVVKEIGLPKKTKGSDFFRSVKIIDESEPSSGFYIHFFTETMEKLPHVETVGDLIVVYNVLVRTWDPGVYALYNKKFSTFAIFEGRNCGNKEPVPYQISSRYRARHEDRRFIMELRKWSVQHKIASLNEELTFKDIKTGESIDLLCKILHVCQMKEKQWMLFLWDGSDTPPATIESKLEDEMDNPLPLQLEPIPLSRDILCTFPPVGTILRMFVDQSCDKRGINYLSSNRWVKFVHVKCEIRAALWCVGLMPFSKLSYLPDDAESVMERQRSYSARLKSKWGRMPISSLITGSSHIAETDHPDASCVTLMSVLTHTEVTYKFKCVVRVVAIFPWMAEDFRAPNGVYRVRLTLEDPTARIHAYLYAEDGVKFFGNFCSMDMLTKKRNMLLGIAAAAAADDDDIAAAAAADDSAAAGTNVPRNPPWMQCCLMSYYVDKTDVWGSRNFRICDTRMVG